MKTTVAKGSTGILATIGGITFSHAAINEWLQTGSLIVGIIVGAASFLSLIKKQKK